MRPIRSGNENDWARENEKREFRGRLRKQREDMILDPPPLVKKISWIFAGIVIAGMVALIVGFMVLIFLAAKG